MFFKSFLKLKKLKLEIKKRHDTIAIGTFIYIHIQR